MNRPLGSVCDEHASFPVADALPEMPRASPNKGKTPLPKMRALTSFFGAKPLSSASERSVAPLSARADSPALPPSSNADSPAAQPEQSGAGAAAARAEQLKGRIESSLPKYKQGSDGGGANDDDGGDDGGGGGGDD